VFGFALCLAAVAHIQARSAAPEQPLTLDQVWVKTTELLEEGSKKLQEYTGLQTQYDKEKLLSYLRTSSSKLKENVDETLKKLDKELKPYNEDVKKNYEKLTAQVNDAWKNLNNLETKKKFEELQQNWQESLKKIADQANDIGKSTGVQVPPTLQKLLNDVYAEVQTAAKSVQDKTQQLVRDAQQELQNKKKN